MTEQLEPHRGVHRAALDVSTECETMAEHVEPYALGVLEEPERRAFAAHLQECPRCRNSLTAAERAAASLPLVLARLSPHAPPPALRDRVLQRAAATVAPRPPWIAWRALAGVAAAAVLALSLVWSAQLGVALARERALRAELAQELAALSGQREIVLEVVDAREKTTRMLRPPAGAPREFATSYGKLYTRPDMPHVVAMTGRMPAPPPGHAYHLWLRLDGQTRFGGPLETNTEGFSQLVFQADRNGPAYESAWLTLQPLAPVGQTPTPQGAVVLRWDPS